MAATETTLGVSPRRARLYKLALLAFALVVGLCLAEAALRVVEKVRLGDRALDDKRIAKDDRLGLRIPPNTLGHDARGFRNASAPERADVVALGDSQTWGVNVPRAEAWPAQLGKITNRRVYSMSLGGYGPVQYWALADDALTLSPKIVVVGLYFGNDLYDAYAMVYCFNRNYASLRRPDAPADFANDTVGARANAYWDQEKSFQQTYLRPGLSGFGDWLRGHTAVGRLVSRARLWPGASDVEFETAKAWAQAFPDRAAVYEEGGVRTVFTTAYRQVALDQSEPRVAEGMRITKELLPQIKQKADASGAHLLILLIPTKESAHAEALRARGRRLDPTLESLAGWESRARS
ncbi:MAG: hypothetical protein M3268_00005, partial [Acidobacteriota bacterium]|nr:hypothetical protein [Acidobacteriota bacterium]